jgi:hypothetical protein
MRINRIGGRLSIIAGTLLSLAACTSSATRDPKVVPAGAPSAEAPHSSIADSDILSGAALTDPMIAGSDVLEAIRRLRPRFLMKGPSGSIMNRNAGAVHASLDGAPLMSIDNLKRIRVGDVSEIRFLNSRDAALRFGSSAETGGVILVTTRR